MRLRWLTIIRILIKVILVRDNDLIRLFRPIIQAGLVAQGYSNVDVIQSNQPTQQGIPSTPTVYFFKVGDKRFGFLGREDIWDAPASTMRHVETQYYETTFQVSALVLINPQNTNQYTASDLVNAVAAIMQSDKTRAILNAADVGILRVLSVNNPYFIDDRDQFEAAPFFEFTLVHQQVLEDTTPIVEGIELEIYRV